MFAVITENDVSQWDDVTGVSYHFPQRYLDILKPGTKVIYYKGKMQDILHGMWRLSREPHYFGIATIGKVYKDIKSSKNDHFATITDYIKFDRAVNIKIDDKYFEIIPENRKSNYWRDGVRNISREEYDSILAYAKLPVEHKDSVYEHKSVTNDETMEYESYVEGSKKEKYTTIYERDRRLRKQAILIHGVTCKVCLTNFENIYGEHGKDFIHVHHVKPISEFGGSVKVDPETDLTVLCPNCHSMVHRYKDKTLSIVDLLNIYKK